jgi:DNA repair exonuclease SbcCD ATPase subunit
MIRFKTLTLRNFLSYGNNVTTFNLERPGTTLIIGQDLDTMTEDTVSSNGVGKTTFLQGLVYALFQRIIGEDFTQDSLINNINKKEMEVTLEFYAENGNLYRIVRHRKMRSGPEGNAVYLFENGKDISVDVGGTNKKIVEVLGMPYELFVRIIVFSASNESFLKLPVTSTTGPNQKTFIEDLFGLSVLTEQAEKLRQIIKDNKADMDIKRVKIEAHQAEHARHLAQIEKAKERQRQWEVQRANSIATLERKQKLVEGVDIERERVAHRKLKQVDTEIREISTEKANAVRECRQHTQQLTKIDNEIALLAENKCPHCKQQFAGAADEIKVKEAELVTLDSTIETLSKEVKELEAVLDELARLKEAVSQEITVDNIEELARIASEVASSRDQIEALKVAPNPHDEALQELEAVVLDEVNFDDLNTIQREIDHQNFLLKLLTKSDSFVRKNLLNKYLPFLNGRVQYYLQLLGLPHTVEFQEDLTAKISRSGVETKFGLLSTGQRARLDFAFSVAFKDVRERLHGRTNICMFDEVLDFGLDAVGVVACAKVIKILAQTEGLSMYVISHRAEVEREFERKMTIQMVKKFSYVKED